MVVNLPELSQIVLLAMISVIGFFTKRAWDKLEMRLDNVEEQLDSIDRKVTRLEVEVENKHGRL